MRTIAALTLVACSKDKEVMHHQGSAPLVIKSVTGLRRQSAKSVVTGTTLAENSAIGVFLDVQTEATNTKCTNENGTWKLEETIRLAEENSLYAYYPYAEGKEIMKNIPVEVTTQVSSKHNKLKNHSEITSSNQHRRRVQVYSILKP